jgi:MerR family transcriptional regulator, thiopeptide resistance regulator
MAYTVAKLAKISGVSVRTLHWYDEVGLLKPAYYGSNGYRYYEEEQLLILQQILFFRELGFELKQIEKVLRRGDFDKIVALSSHRQVLQKNLEQTRKLIKTIDRTIEHLKGNKKMKEQEMYYGFSREKQAKYEKQIIERFGEKGKKHIAESHENVKNWSKTDWELSNKEFDEICKELVKILQKRFHTSSKDVQSIILRHYQWLKKFWTPTKESYTGHGQFIIESDLRKAYETYDPQLPEFLAEAIRIFADNKLN